MDSSNLVQPRLLLFNLPCKSICEMVASSTHLFIRDNEERCIFAWCIKTQKRVATVHVGLEPKHNLISNSMAMCSKNNQLIVLHKQRLEQDAVHVYSSLPPFREISAFMCEPSPQYSHGYGIAAMDDGRVVVCGSNTASVKEYKGDTVTELYDGGAFSFPCGAVATENGEFVLVTSTYEMHRCRVKDGKLETLNSDLRVRGSAPRYCAVRKQIITYEDGHAIFRDANLTMTRRIPTDLFRGQTTVTCGPGGILFIGSANYLMVLNDFWGRAILMGFHERAGSKGVIRRVQRRCSHFDVNVFRRILALAGDSKHVPMAMCGVGMKANVPFTRTVRVSTQDKRPREE